MKTKPPHAISAHARPASSTYSSSRRIREPRLRCLLILPFLPRTSRLTVGAFLAGPAGALAAAFFAGGRLLPLPEPAFRLPATSTEGTQPNQQLPTRRALQAGGTTRRARSANARCDVPVVPVPRIYRYDRSVARRAETIELAVLGLLHEGPMHGYELRKRLNLMLGWGRVLSYGSLYPTLKKMLRGNLIEEAATTVAPVTRRPRIVYQLTEAGQDEFERLMME